MLAGAVLLLLGACASPPLLPPDARGVYAFDLETQLGRRFSMYAATEAACRDLRAAPPGEGFPLSRATVESACYQAALRRGGPAWGFEIDGASGAVIGLAPLCDELREFYARRVPAASVTACAPAALTPARHP